MRIIEKVAIELIIYMVLFSIYMIWSDRKFIYEFFWRTYYYTLMYAFPLALLLTVLPLAPESFTRFIIWAGIIFLSELIVYNGVLANQEYTVFYKYCTSKLFGYIFSGSIVLFSITAFIVKFLK